MRHPVTDVALLAYIAKKKLGVVSYAEATKACKSSSSASRALHQLINEGILDPQPKLLGLRYVTQYVVTDKGRKVAELALQLTQLREVAKVSHEKMVKEEEATFRNENTEQVQAFSEIEKLEQPVLEQPLVQLQTRKKRQAVQKKSILTKKKL